MYRARQEVDRQANLLGAVALRTQDAVGTACAGATGLPAAEATALCVLVTLLPGTPLQPLADALALTQPGATRLVDRLAARGLVRRDPGPDGRTRALRPTVEGRRLATAALDARRRVLESLLAGLADADRARLGDLLAQVLEPLATSPTDAVRGCRACDPVACGHHDGRCPVTTGLDARGRGT